MGFNTGTIGHKSLIDYATKMFVLLVAAIILTILFSSDAMAWYESKCNKGTVTTPGTFDCCPTGSSIVVCGKKCCEGTEICCYNGCFEPCKGAVTGKCKTVGPNEGKAGAPCKTKNDCCRAPFCTDGKCSFERGSDLGKNCTKGGDCESGFCSDGVCCDKECDGTCDSCNMAGSIGTCKTLPTLGCAMDPLSVSWIGCAGKSACCAAGSCVSQDGKCVAKGKMGSFLNPGGHDNSAYCMKDNSSKWTDCDINNNYKTACNPSCGPLVNGSCSNPLWSADNSICGKGTGVLAGETGVGEYTSTSVFACCGDDANEFYKTGDSVLPGGSQKCCNAATDCVDSTGKCVGGGTRVGNLTCVDGSWGLPKYSWDASKIGQCAEQSQCLVDPRGSVSLDNKPELWFRNNISGGEIVGTYAGPKCIANGQYILDHLCESGKWTTRTRNIAGVLVRDSSWLNDDYTVFCDDYKLSVNYYQYPVADAIAAERFLQSNGECGGYPCFNSFCVLVSNADGRVRAFGTSHNPDTQGAYSLARVFQLMNMNSNSSSAVATNVTCPNDQMKNLFEACGTSGLKYNAMQRSFVYTLPDGGAYLEGAQFMARVGSMITKPFDALYGAYSRLNSRDTQAIIYALDKSPGFDRLYLLKRQTLVVYGLQDRVNTTERMFINYTGFSTDLCGGLKYRLDRGSSNCSGEPGSQLVFANRSIGADSELFKGWIDMTAGLRVNPAASAEQEG